VADRYLRIIGQLVAQMTGASAFSAPKMYERLLAQLTEMFEADSAFLRHDNRTLKASMRIAEWPQQCPSSPAKIEFVDNDEVLAGDLRAPTVIAAGGSKFAYSSGLVARHGAASSIAVAPLLWGTMTTGVIGLTKSRGRQWASQEIDTLGVVAALFAQLQARIAAESRLHRLAERDELTGLHNRRALNAELRRRLAAGRSGPIAALYVDVDRLKSINDHLGHTAGDAVIQACADRLMATAGKHAMIARVGGDEFVVVPQLAMSAAAAEALGRRLQMAACRPVQAGGRLVTRTVSVGVAVGMPGVDTGPDLLRRADQAALAVKQKGGNAVVCGHELPTQEASRREIELDAAGVVEVQYQPEVDLRTGEILAVEAVPCWRPARGWPADASAAAAELLPLLGRSDRKVVRRACGDFSRWRSRGLGRDVTLSLSIPPTQLAADSFVDIVSSAIDEFGIAPGLIRLGIAEHAIARDIENAQMILARLRDIGIRIAIADFGGGDMALSQLKSLPTNTLKINNAFTRELGDNATDLAVVRTIIAVAETVGLELTAQGVETSEAAATLLRHGCNRAQGPLLSSPVCSDVMESLLSRRRIPLPHKVIDESIKLFPVEAFSATAFAERAAETAAS
jgi:diguanylate cyclase (GGDEF)-like protein